MIISLTGFMGSGKSSAGKALAALLDYQFVDLDKYIEHKLGRSIKDVFAEDGEMVFRAVEAEAVRDVIMMSRLVGSNVVLALGGGTLMTEATRPLILKHTNCFYLKASPDVLLSHLKGSTDRPLFDEESFRSLLSKREPIYSLASVTLDTDGLTPEQIAQRISVQNKERG